MLKAFDDMADKNRYRRCLQLERMAEWVEWDNIMKQDRDWKKIIVSQKTTSSVSAWARSRTT